MKKTISAFILAMATSVAIASQCPMDMAKIDEALAGDHGLSTEQVSQVETLREQGEKLHEEGKHQESVETLGEAKSILGIE